LLFASLQGETAKELLDDKYIKNLDSMVLYQNGEIDTKSTAILKVCKILGGIWSIFYVFIIIPSFIRNGFYNFIASIRYKLFGKESCCRIPTEKEKNKILQ